MAAQRRWRRFRARYFPGPHDAETDDTGMDEIELAEEAHRLRLKLLLAEEKEAAILLSLAANKVLFTVVRDPSPVSRAHTHTQTHSGVHSLDSSPPWGWGHGGGGTLETRVVTRHTSGHVL